MKLERLLRSWVGWTLTIVFWSCFVLLDLVTFKRLPYAWQAAAIRKWARVALACLGLKLHFENESTILGQAPRVVIINHQSSLDLIWGGAVCPPAPLAIGKREIIYIPVFNVIWWVLDFIRIDRSNHTKAVAALQGVAQEIVRGRRTLLIAPEGTRTLNGDILPFKKGAFLLARQAGVPIYPIVVHGAFELQPKGRILPYPGTLKIRFLPPVSTEGLTKMNEPAFIARVRESMIAALEEMRRG